MKKTFLQIRAQRVAAICVALFSILLVSTPSFAAVNTGVKQGSCVRDGKYVVCSGSTASAGGGGHYTNGNSGSGNYSNRSATRFDGFAPDPNYVKCGEPNKYLHYRVALSRDGKEVLAGVPGAKYWDSAWDVNSGFPVNSYVPEGDGLSSRADTVIGPHWQFNRTGSNVACRELLAPQDVVAQLRLQKPTLEIYTKNANSSTTPIISKAAVNQKNSKATITIDQSKVDGDIPIKYELMANMTIVYKLDPNTGIYEPLPTDQKNITLKSAVTTVKEIAVVQPDGTTENTITSKTESDIKFKTKGVYRFQVLAIFNVYIGTDPIPKPLWLLSDDANIEVISVKSVNRTTNNK